jgi:phage repressor protein C with HTH and peptisase S24 domain
VTVDDLKEMFGVTDDQDLGPIFNRKKGAVSVWRKTGVPANIERVAMRLIEARKKFQETSRPEQAFEIPRPSGRIPIISWAQAGPDGFFEDAFPTGAGFGEINRPYDVTDPNAYALIISGDSMIPKFEPGDVILVSPNMGVRTGDYAVARLKDGTVAAKRVKAKNGGFVLESVNLDYPPVECKAEEVVFLHRIVWVKQRG